MRLNHRTKKRIFEERKKSKEFQNLVNSLRKQFEYTSRCSSMDLDFPPIYDIDDYFDLYSHE